MRETLDALAWKLEKAVAAKDKERELERQNVLQLMNQSADIFDDERQEDREHMAKQVREQWCSLIDTCALTFDLTPVMSIAAS